MKKVRGEYLQGKQWECNLKLRLVKCKNLITLTAVNFVRVIATVVSTVAPPCVENIKVWLIPANSDQKYWTGNRSRLHEQQRHSFVMDSSTTIHYFEKRHWTPGTLVIQAFKTDGVNIKTTIRRNKKMNVQLSSHDIDIFCFIYIQKITKSISVRNPELPHLSSVTAGTWIWFSFFFMFVIVVTKVLLYVHLHPGAFSLRQPCDDPPAPWRQQVTVAGPQTLTVSGAWYCSLAES